MPLSLTLSRLALACTALAMLGQTACKKALTAAVGTGKAGQSLVNNIVIRVTGDNNATASASTLSPVYLVATATP